MGRNRIHVLGVCLFTLLMGGRWCGAEDRDWRIVERSQGTGPSVHREIEMQPKLDPVPGTRFQGSVTGNGYTVLHDLNGNTLRGFVQPDGTAVLRDQNGDYHRFNTRQQP